MSEIQFLPSLLQELMKILDVDNEHYLTREVAVGHFATHLPNYTDTRCISYVTEMCHKVREFMPYRMPDFISSCKSNSITSNLTSCALVQQLCS